MLDVPESQSQLNTAGGSSDGGFLDMDDSDVDHEREHEKEGESEEGDGGYDNEREDGREDGRDGGDGASMRDDREGSIDSHASASSRPSVVSSGAGSGIGHDGMQNPSRRKSSLSRSHGSGHTQQSQTQQGRPSEESAYLPYLAEQQSPPQQSHQGHPHMPPPAMRQDSSMSVASGSTANESYSQHQYGLQGQRAPEDSAMGGESMYTQSQSTLVHQQQQSTPTGSISGTGAGGAGGGDDQPTNPDDVWPPVNGDGREPNRYRELPLLAADLPHTTVTVVTSSIKPNDRGKDLLSFIIAVEPGSHKAGWRIEKQYTEVMSLDHRVRSVIGKSAIKKIVSLPEGKLWRDHAPARVDQRKVRNTYSFCLKELLF
jgi:RalA-binding protein 1